MQFFFGVVTLIIGIFWTGSIVSIIMELFKFPMQPGELEIERMRCDEHMERAAGRFLIAGWRRFVIQKQIKEISLLNDEFRIEQKRLFIQKQKYENEKDALGKEKYSAFEKDQKFESKDHF